MSDTPRGKYGAVIQKARSEELQTSNEPENQKTGLPDEKEEDVNLSIKVSKRLRRHWVAEAKRRDTTLTAAIISALKEKFGEPVEE
jgi:predicted HicB family RNase H-like nuclease